MYAEARALLRSAAADRAAREPVCLRAAVCRAFHNRWTTLLPVVTQDALAASLVEEGVALLDGVGVASRAQSTADALLDHSGCEYVVCTGVADTEAAAAEVVFEELAKVQEEVAEAGAAGHVAAAAAAVVEAP